MVDGMLIPYQSPVAPMNVSQESVCREKRSPSLRSFACVAFCCVIAMAVSLQRRNHYQSIALSEAMKTRGMYLDPGAFSDDPPQAIFINGISIGPKEVSILGQLLCVRNLTLEGCSPHPLLQESGEHSNNIRRTFVSIRGVEWPPEAISSTGIFNAERLWICGWDMTGAVYDSLRDNNIEELRLFECNLGRGWPEVIGRMSKLRILDITGSDVRNSDVIEFRRRRPDVHLDIGTAK